ncbi:MAG TPA: YceI family protein [Candidatus Saccharimonadales bacterium]|nr:YceI family protein [Candidatus Saccharimonadales bacterium]
MNRSSWRTLSLIFVVLITPVALIAQQMRVALEPSQTQIEFTLGAVMHTVHGTFRLKSNSLQINPETHEASGELVVDAATGDSGSQARDRKMTKDILEAQRFPEIAFIARKVEGKLAATGASNLQLIGVFRIHGQDHPLTLPTNVDAHGSAFTASTQFEVPYQEWGMKNPSTLFLRVSDKVNIEIRTQGQLSTATAATPGK